MQPPWCDPGYAQVKFGSESHGAQVPGGAPPMTRQQGLRVAARAPHGRIAGRVYRSSHAGVADRIEPVLLQVVSSN